MVPGGHFSSTSEIENFVLLMIIWKASLLRFTSCLLTERKAAVVKINATYEAARILAG